MKDFLVINVFYFVICLITQVFYLIFISFECTNKNNNQQMATLHLCHQYEPNKSVIDLAIMQ